MNRPLTTSFPVPGLVVVEDFLTPDEELEVVSSIDAESWLGDLRRRVQHHGYRYDYRERRVNKSMSLGPLPAWADLLAWLLEDRGIVRAGRPDQVIVNEYVGAQGISRHVDCVPCFGPEIVTVSLLETWTMTFRYGQEKVDVPLPRRSAAVLSGDARLLWTHEIAARKTEPATGEMRGRRVSATFRKVVLSA